MSGPESVIIPSAWELDWEVRETTRDGNVPGPVRKVLRRDPSTGGITYLLHLPPGWHDNVLDWHPTTEEAYVLAGSVILGDNLLDAGSALYRPPGILHGPVRILTDAAASTLRRMNGDSRILRYNDDEFPHRHMQPITDDYKDWPVRWTETLDTKELEWDQVSEGGWSGCAVKWLHRKSGNWRRRRHAVDPTGLERPGERCSRSDRGVRAGRRARCRRHRVPSLGLRLPAARCARRRVRIRSGRTAVLVVG